MKPLSKISTMLKPATMNQIMTQKKEVNITYLGVKRYF